MDINPNIVYSNRLLRNVLQEDIKLNVQFKNFLEVSEGSIIYKADDESSSLYLLIKGQVKIKFYETFKTSSIVIKSENEFFGENEIIEKIPRKSTAMAVDQSLLYVISGKELEELTQNEIINKILSNAVPGGGIESQTSFNEPIVSNKPDTEEYDSIETPQEVNTSSQTISTKPEDIHERNDDLSWNDSNVQEFKDDLNDEQRLNDDKEEFNRDKTNLYDSIVQNEHASQSFQSDELEPLFDSRETQNRPENGEDSIIDRIKEEIKDSITESKDGHKTEIIESEQETDFDPAILEKNKANEKEHIQNVSIPMEISTVESQTKIQEDSVEYPAKETRELNRKITETLVNEISDPVEIIKKYAQLLMHKSLSADAINVLQKIIDQSNYIITSLTTYTAYLNEKIKLKSQILQTSGVLDDILYLLAGYTEFRKIKLYRKIEADAPIYVDKNLLYQVCLHIVKFLCTNIKDGGSLFVSVKRTKDIISLEFKSTGEKIPDEQLQTIFEPFAIKGIPGLGLAQKIIHEHNGNITVNNSDISGLEIELQLPIVK